MNIDDNLKAMGMRCPILSRYKVTLFADTLDFEWKFETESITA